MANENITVVLKAGTEYSLDWNGTMVENVLREDTVAEVFAMGDEWNIYLVGTEYFYVKASEDK